ncbi:MAG: hypothetical protein WC829_14135 [Hyphomicrobium sp.]
MTKPTVATISPQKARPLWVVPLVTALVILAIIMVLYPASPPV